MTRGPAEDQVQPNTAGIPGAKIGATSRPPTTPAAAPERVFPGTDHRRELGSPEVLPPNIAAVSHTQVTTSGKEDQPSPGPAARRFGSVPDEDDRRRKRAGVGHAEHGDGRGPSGRSVRRSLRQRPNQQEDEPDGRQVRPIAPRGSRRCRAGPPRARPAAAAAAALATPYARAGRVPPRRRDRRAPRVPSAAAIATSAARGRPPYQTTSSTSGIATAANPTRSPSSDAIRPGRARTGGRAAGTREWPRRGVGG